VESQPQARLSTLEMHGIHCRATCALATGFATSAAICSLLATPLAASAAHQKQIWGCQKIWRCQSRGRRATRLSRATTEVEEKEEKEAAARFEMETGTALRAGISSSLATTPAANVESRDQFREDSVDLNRRQRCLDQCRWGMLGRVTGCALAAASTCSLGTAIAGVVGMRSPSRPAVKSRMVTGLAQNAVITCSGETTTAESAAPLDLEVVAERQCFPSLILSARRRCPDQRLCQAAGVAAMIVRLQRDRSVKRATGIARTAATSSSRETRPAESAARPALQASA